jgi:cyclin-dependent kinase
MVSLQVPLFPGDSELQQLLYIFRLLGTPTEEEWAGVSQLRDWHEFPNWRKQDLYKYFSTLEPAGVDLMEQMFVYNPAKRVSVGPAASMPDLSCSCGECL